MKLQVLAQVSSKMVPCRTRTILCYLKMACLLKSLLGIVPSNKLNKFINFSDKKDSVCNAKSACQNNERLFSLLFLSYFRSVFLSLYQWYVLIKVPRRGAALLIKMSMELEAKQA